ISHIKKQTTTAYLCIVCESKPLYTSSDHLFYLPQQNIWVPAHLLKSIAGVGVAISLKKGKNHLPKTTINIISSESCNNAGGPEEDPEKKRRCNTMHKSEFFNKIKDNYEHYKNGIYRRKKGTKGIANAEYLEWDHLHNDVEAFGKNKWHLGSVDAKTLRLYRSAIKGRCLTI